MFFFALRGSLFKLTPSDIAYWKKNIVSQCSVTSMTWSVTPLSAFDITFFILASGLRIHPPNDNYHYANCSYLHWCNIVSLFCAYFKVQKAPLPRKAIFHPVLLIRQAKNWLLRALRQLPRYRIVSPLSTDTKLLFNNL